MNRILSYSGIALTAVLLTGCISIETTPSPSADRLPIPSETAQINLVNGTMALFADGVAAKDFTTFYDNLGSLWHAQTTPAQLRSLFTVFIDREIPMQGVKTTTPTITPPASIDDSNGFLVVQGNYALPEFHLVFTVKYQPQDGAWKLAYFNAETEK